MADARPTFPLPQRYTQAQTEAVQPPDDRTYSAEVTDFSQSPASSQCARIVSPYTRSNIVTSSSPFVKRFFGNNYKVLLKFSVISQNCFSPMLVSSFSLSLQYAGHCEPASDVTGVAIPFLFQICRPIWPTIPSDAGDADCRVAAFGRLLAMTQKPQSAPKSAQNVRKRCHCEARSAVAIRLPHNAQQCKRGETLFSFPIAFLYYIV